MRDNIENRMRFASQILVAGIASGTFASGGAASLGIGVFDCLQGPTIGLFRMRLSGMNPQFVYNDLIAFVGNAEDDVRMTRVERGWIYSYFLVVDPKEELTMKMKCSNKLGDFLDKCLRESTIQEGIDQ